MIRFLKFFLWKPEEQNKIFHIIPHFKKKNSTPYAR